MWWFKVTHIPQYLIDAAALVGLGVLVVDFNRRVLLKAFDILSTPPSKFLRGEETKEEDYSEEEKDYSEE